MFQSGTSMKSSPSTILTATCKPLSPLTEHLNQDIADAETPRFCLGDAVHRHPPFNGLGSNTCIQDAFNLAWKVAYVHKNLASPSLLESYNAERQPVGLGVITRANQ